MPTYEYPEAFLREFRRLPVEQQRRFRAVVAELVAALGHRPPRFRSRLRVKRVRGQRGVWETADGRATFEYGDEITPGQAHVVWRRIGDHSILRSP